MQLYKKKRKINCEAMKTSSILSSKIKYFSLEHDPVAGADH